MILLRICILLCLLLAGCVHSASLPQTTGQHRSVEGLTILINSQPYAKLVLIGKDPRFGNSCRGIAIHYIDSNKYEWISPSKGWQVQKNNIIYDQIPDVVREWGDTHFPDGKVLQNYHAVSPDTFGKLELRGKLTISPDGTELTFIESGLFGPKKRRHIIK